MILDHERCLQLLCDAQPQDPNGRRPAYHAVTSGVLLEEIVRRVTGMDMRKVWRAWFKEPMGLGVLDYGASAAVRSRITEQSLTGHLSKRNEFHAGQHLAFQPGPPIGLRGAVARHLPVPGGAGEARRQWYATARGQGQMFDAEVAQQTRERESAVAIIGA